MAIAPTESIQARLRQFGRTSPRLIRTLQAARASLHFGPWRYAARAAIRWRRPPRQADAVRTPSRVPLEVAELVRTLKSDGMARAGMLPAHVVTRLLTLTDY